MVLSQKLYIWGCCLYLQGPTGFPGSAGRVGPPGPPVSTSPLLKNIECLTMSQKHHKWWNLILKRKSRRHAFLTDCTVVNIKFSVLQQKKDLKDLGYIVHSNICSSYSISSSYTTWKAYKQHYQDSTHIWQKSLFLPGTTWRAWASWCSRKRGSSWSSWRLWSTWKTRRARATRTVW